MQVPIPIPATAQHKKFRAAAFTAVVSLLMVEYFGMDPATVETYFVYPMLAAIGAQGIADFGKEKAKVEIANGHHVATTEPTGGKTP